MKLHQDCGWPHRSGVCNGSKGGKLLIENTQRIEVHVECFSFKAKKPLCRGLCTQEQLKTNILLPSGLRSRVFGEGKSSRGCCGLNWCTVTQHQTQTGGQHPHFVSPHERSTRRMLSPSIPSSSLSLEWVMRYWNHMPSWIPHGSSHPVPIPAVLCWPLTLCCREGGLPASCVGSKYLHSPPSRVVRRRGLDVLGYVKSNPLGRIFNRLSLFEQICEKIHLRESFLILLISRDTKADNRKFTFCITCLKKPLKP